MDHRKLSEMIELWRTREITAFEFHLFLIDNAGSPEAGKVMALMSDLLTQSITLEQFFVQALRVADFLEANRRPVSERQLRT